MEKTILSFSLVVITTFTFIVLLKRLLRSHPHRQNLPPTGPWHLPIIGHLHLLWRPAHQCLARISATYGPVLLLKFGSRRVLLVSSPSAAEECLTKNDIVFANRPSFLFGKHLCYDNSIFPLASYGPHWRNLRRFASTEILSSTRTDEFSSVRQGEVGYFVSQLFHSSTGEFKHVELKTKCFELVANIMMQMTVGKRLALITAGIESAAGVLEWALALLLNHPEVLEKARMEIEAHVGHERLIADADLPNLHYLHNIIRETLRLFPAGPLLLPRESSADCTVAGYDIPRGTMLIINAYAIHRDPDLWEDAAKFKPERFEGGGGGVMIRGFKLISFGSGRRNCPGELMATRELGLALGAFIQCFEWKRVGDEEVDMAEGQGLNMPRVNPLQALYKPRSIMVDVMSQL